MSTKKHILELLESNRGKHISGEDMAGQLGVTRNAVWKVIKELEKEGYQIEAVTNRGYCLSEENDILSVQGILPFLKDREKVHEIFVFDSLESTNKTAKEMALEGAKHGTVILADQQTGGKGRHGRSFSSPPGHGIYMSFILHPEWLVQDIPTMVTALAAVTVCEAVEAVSGKEPQIKWVNDVFLDRKKICGILSEAVTDFETGGIHWVVVGIGINFSTPEEVFPEEVRQIAGSIFPEGHPSITRNRLAAEMINRLVLPEGQYARQAVFEQYKKRMMMLGETVQVNGWKETYEAVALDVDEIGRLVVQKENGQITSLSSGEIRIQLPEK